MYPIQFGKKKFKSGYASFFSCIFYVTHLKVLFSIGKNTFHCSASEPHRKFNQILSLLFFLTRFPSKAKDGFNI
jgi:hypothetical protein